MGVAFVKFRVGREGASSANVRYITRGRATDGEPERVWTRNMPEYATEGRTYKEQVGNLREYARQREEDELQRERSGGGHTRTHYRAIYSFDRQVSDEQARKMVDGHLRENFRQGRTVAAIHRDTDHTHVHVWIDARRVDEKKIDLGHRTYRTLDERWAKECAREFQDRSYYDRHMEAKGRKLEIKREAVRAKERGEKVERRTERVEQRGERVESVREMERQQYGAGARGDDESRAGGDQRRATDGEPALTRGEREAERSVELSKQAYGEARQAVREAGRALPDVAGVREELARMGERVREVERMREEDDDRGR